MAVAYVPKKFFCESEVLRVPSTPPSLRDLAKMYFDVMKYPMIVGGAAGFAYGIFKVWRASGKCEKKGTSAVAAYATALTMFTVSGAFYGLAFPVLELAALFGDRMDFLVKRVARPWLGRSGWD
jgi:hypothetical protein